MSRRSRWPFWVFVGAMVVALVGGGSIVLLVKRTPDRRNFAAVREAPMTTPAPPQPEPREEPQKPAVPPPRPSTAEARDPAKAAALFERAERRRAEQDVDAAIPLYLAALAADPSLAEAHKKLGLCYQLKGDKQNAAARYRRYLATDPPDADRVRIVLRTLE